MHFPLPVVFSLLMFLILGFLIWRLFRHSFYSRSAWFLSLSGSALLFAFVFFAGTWAFLSMYLRWIFLIIYLIAVIYSFRKHKNVPFKSEKPAGAWITVLRVFTIIIGLFLNYMYIDSGMYKGAPVELQFPYKNGDFYIMQGGSNRLSNLFHSNFSKAGYGYAMDIAELNTWGNRAKSIYSSNLKDYEIYNDTIYSPCNGEVILLINGVEDNLPGSLNVKQVHGNHIIIQSQGYRVFMAHLKKDKIFVKPGEKVMGGQPLALQGNAGFTVEPHLHLNVLKDYADDDMYTGISVPATFKGKFYTLNDVIRN